MDHAELVFALALEYVETSRDSNWRRTSVTVRGRRLTIRRESGGPFPPEDSHAERGIDAAAERRLLDALRERGLAVDRELRRPTDGIGVVGRLAVEVGGAPPSRLFVEGRLDALGDDAAPLHRAEAFIRLAEGLPAGSPSP